MILVCTLAMYFASQWLSTSWFELFVFADNMEVDGDYESSLDEEPVSYFSYLVQFFL
jgi:hypothetical protein